MLVKVILKWSSQSLKESEKKGQFIWWTVAGSNLDIRHSMEKCQKVWWWPDYLKKQISTHDLRVGAIIPIGVIIGNLGKIITAPKYKLYWKRRKFFDWKLWEITIFPQVLFFELLPILSCLKLHKFIWLFFFYLHFLMHRFWSFD